MDVVCSVSIKAIKSQLTVVIEIVCSVLVSTSLLFNRKQSKSTKGEEEKKEDNRCKCQVTDMCLQVLFRMMMIIMMMMMLHRQPSADAIHLPLADK